MTKKDLGDFSKNLAASLFTMEIGGAAIGAGGVILGVGISKKDRAVITLGAVLATAGFIFSKKAANTASDEVSNQIDEYNQLATKYTEQKKVFANHLIKDIENVSFLNGYLNSIINSNNNTTTENEVKSE